MQMLSKEQRKFLESTTLQYMEHLDLAGAWLASRGIDLEFARRSGLGVVVDPPKAHEHLRDRLCIPYLTPVGVSSQTFRCIQQHDCKAISGHGKYMRASGTKTRLYGVLSYEEAGDYICLTEGEIDALSLHQCGLPALGVPGSENWEKHWTSILQDFSTVYVFSDGDEAGQKFAKRVMSEYDRAVNVKMPDGEDVNSMLVQHGADWLRGRVEDE